MNNLTTGKFIKLQAGPSAALFPTIQAKLIDTSKFANTPKKSVVAAADASLIAFIKEKNIVIPVFGGKPQFHTYSKEEYFAKLFGTYAICSNEEPIAAKVFFDEVIKNIPKKRRNKMLYIGFEHGYHPPFLQKYFQEVVVLNKFSSDDKNLLERLKDHIQSDPSYSAGSFSAGFLSHCHYFLPTKDYEEFHVLINSLIEPQGSVHSVIHRGLGQTAKFVEHFGGSAEDSFNISQLPLIIAKSLNGNLDKLDYVLAPIKVSAADSKSMAHIANFLALDTKANMDQELMTTVYYLPAEIKISGINLQATAQKHGFLLWDTNALAGLESIEAYTEAHLKEPDGGYGISRFDEHFLYRLP